MNLAGKRVLVTGADGFIGSHLVERLVAEGCRVRAFVFYNSFDSWGWLDRVDATVLRDVEVVPGDVRDPGGVRAAMDGVQVAFHLAALIGIPFSYHSPDSYVDTNIKGTLNILQAARATGCERVLVTSTSEVYGSARYVPIDEAHPLQGQSPYAATKIAADKLAEAFHLSFGLPVITVRPFNAFGPRQSARAIIPTVITQLLSGAGEVRVGNLETSRDFTFVLDTVEGFVRLARCDEAVGEVVNVASGHEITIGHLVGELARQINPAARVVPEAARRRPERSEVTRLLGSCDKLLRLTSWQPNRDLSSGLSETIRWFQRPEHLAGYRPGRYTI
jgi:NAD dependent epimerase/dehydratase